MTEYVAVLDVESMGLYGKAFSYGIVVGDKLGNVVEEIYVYSDTDYHSAKTPQVNCTKFENDITWVEEYVKPHVSLHSKYSPGSITYAFYETWKYLKETYKDISLFADVPFPVESRFINQVVLQYVNSSELFNFSPYPLLCVTSFRRAHNLPDYFDRLPNELPMHHPLMDARQSYRGLVEVYNLINK